MKRKNFYTILMLLLASSSFAQVSTLQSPLSSASVEERNPCLSANGRTIIFETVAINDRTPQVVISTQKGGVWSRPESIPGANTSITTISNGGFFINAVGSQVYFSSSRANGVGGNDLWMIKRSPSGSWGAPMNLAKPINSTGHEVDPAVSPDGRFLFFVRLGTSKTAAGLGTGKIFMAERSGRDGWKEPKELPANITSGSELAPRLLADGKTLVFASSRAGGKGGLDIYQSKWNEDGTWTAPVRMDFLCTAGDDRYVSIPAGGGLAYYSMKGKSTNDLVRVPVPEQFQPQKLMLYQGTILDEAGKPMYGKVLLNTKNKRKSWIVYSADDGRFSVPLVRGEVYDVALMANDAGYGYVSDLFDLSASAAFEEKLVDVRLVKLSPGKKIFLNNSSDLSITNADWANEQEVNRVFNLLKFNPTLRIQLMVFSDTSLVTSREFLSNDDVKGSDGQASCKIDTLSSFTDSTGALVYRERIRCVNSPLVDRAVDIKVFLIKMGIPASRILTTDKLLYEYHKLPAELPVEPKRKAAILIEVL